MQFHPQGSECEPIEGAEVDSNATTIADLKKDFNDLLAVLYATGLIVADKADFLEAIASAQVLLDEAEVGEEEGQYPGRHTTHLRLRFWLQRV